MNIKILDSWLREYLDTKASAKQIAECLSLTSVSVERLTEQKDDWLYDIEITTNRVDLMSVVGLAREAAAVLPQFDIYAKFLESKLNRYSSNEVRSFAPNDSSSSARTINYIEIVNDPRLVNRIMAVIMDVNIKQSPDDIKRRLEASGMRSLNNLIDVTNYVMREIGHPAHVFDYDRLTTKKLIIRQSKTGEIIETLDDKKHILRGGDIVADNGENEIVDLLGVMGTANSVVTDKTKRILFFIDNNDPVKIRKTSMGLGIRSEAAILNEKGVDSELAIDALFRGIELYKKIADGKILSDIIDIYPNKPESRTVSVTSSKINNVIGVDIPIKTSCEILKKLGFETTVKDDVIESKVPFFRINDIKIPEDLIEEIARVYGYHKIPSELPQLVVPTSYSIEKSEFYWEMRVKNAFKYWGFTEAYTYSIVSSDLFEGPLDEAVTLSNPLTEDMVYLRKTLVPSMLQVVRENKNRQELKIFELSNVYHKRKGDLPDEILTIAAIIKKPNISFYEVKGYVEALLEDMGIKNARFQKSQLGGEAADICIGRENVGDIELLDRDIADFELNFKALLNFANLKKTYKPISKFPSAIEDIRISLDPKIGYETIVETIKGASKLVVDVGLLDVYEDKKTFRITYHAERNLTADDLSDARKKIIEALEKKLKAKAV